MNPNIFGRKSVIALLLVICLVGVWAGCTTTVKERQQGQPVTGPTGETREWEGGGQYYLDDVRVPSELNYQPNKSFVYETPNFKAGVMVFTKWRLDISSMIEFFTFNMEKDNWKLVNVFKGKESFLNFTKPNKTCAIKMFDKWYGTTVVEIRVGPLGEKKM